MAASSGQAAGWYADPARRFRHRYWSGDEWTDRVVRAGSREQELDPLEPGLAHVAPTLSLPQLPEPKEAPTLVLRPKANPWRFVVALVALAGVVGVAALVVGISHGASDNPTSATAPLAGGNLATGTTGATTTTIPPGPPLVSEADAQAVVAKAWPAREQALAANDVKATDRIEEGVAREFDDAVSVDDRALPPGSQLRRVRTYSTARVVIPPGGGYPTSFLAEVATTAYSSNCCTPTGDGPPWVELMIFTRANPTAGWKISLDTGYSGGPDLFFGSANGTPVGLVLGDSESPIELAQYWQTWVDTGAAPPNTPYLPGFWTTQQGAALAATARPGGLSCSQCQATLHFDPDFAPTHKWSFPVFPPVADVQSGPYARELACSVVRGTMTVTDTGGAALVQDPSRENWGGWLKPGRYRSLEYRDLHEMCVMTNSLGYATVVAGNGGPVDIVGKPAQDRAKAAVTSPRSS